MVLPHDAIPDLGQVIRDRDPDLWSVLQDAEVDRALLVVIDRDAAAARARCPQAAAQIDRQVDALRKQLADIAHKRRLLRALGVPRKVTRG